MVKNLFDYAKQKEQGDAAHATPAELIIDDMDEEQIWQQLELQNETLWPKCLRATSKLLSLKDDSLSVRFKIAGEESSAGEEVDDEEEQLDEEESIQDEEESDEEDHDDDDDDNSAAEKPMRKGRKSIVDDSFFKLSEMEDFLEAEDRKEMRKTSGANRVANESDDDDIDYFKADDDDDDKDDDDGSTDENYKYKEFFGNERAELNNDDENRQQRRERLDVKNKKSVKRKQEDLGLENSDIDEDADEAEIEEANDEDDKSERVKFDLSKNTYRSDSEDNGNSEDDDDDRTASQPAALDPSEMSTFEHRQERLRLRIQDMEEQVMGEKSWQLRGEIDATSRPQNSLLEEVLEYDSTVRPAPVITEATTMQLEDIIRQRIKDKAWNDVERKFKPTTTPQEFRKKLVLDQEKSKESLAQIYEKEYLREVDKLDPSAADRDEEEPKEHREIRSQMKDLFLKLDALSNFFYTPKPAQAEAKIITNVPAISMEEVAPLAVSDAQLLAPEEVSGKQKGSGDLLGKSERTKTDKSRERRQKKKLQRHKQQAKEKRDAVAAAAGILRSSKEDKKKLLEKVSKSRNVQKVRLLFRRGS